MKLTWRILPIRCRNMKVNTFKMMSLIMKLNWWIISIRYGDMLVNTSNVLWKFMYILPDSPSLILPPLPCHLIHCFIFHRHQWENICSWGEKPQDWKSYGAVACISRSIREFIKQLKRVFRPYLLFKLSGSSILFIIALFCRCVAFFETTSVRINYSVEFDHETC